MTAVTYTLRGTSHVGFAETVERVRCELAREGFGVLCEIDIQAVLRQKLGVEGAPYIILGACNPRLAHAALECELELGALLPCNVIVYESGGTIRVSAIDAERMLSLIENEDLMTIAADARGRLARVVTAVTSGSDS